MATATETQTYQNYIDGEWVESSDGSTLENVNPADTTEVNGLFAQATREDAQRAIEAAEAAQSDWEDVPPPERARYIREVRELALERKDELAEIMTREEGKPTSEAKGEIDKGCNLLEFYDGSGMRLKGESAYSELPNNYIYTRRNPLGVVSIITPWNFPWAIPCWKIAPALVAGNSVVFKPASNTPKLAVKLVELFEEAGLPDGVLNLVVGSGSTVGDELLNNETIDGVSFTGSNNIGNHVNAQAAKRLIPACLEMGGKNACIILPDANKELALGGIVNGATGNAGQRCTATSRLIVHEDVADEMVDMVLEEFKNLDVGPGLDDSDVAAVVDEGAYKDILEYIRIGEEEDGADLIYGGEPLEGGKYENGNFIQPALFDNVEPDMTIAQEEIFGPVLSIIRVSSVEEAIEVNNGVKYGLSTAIYSENFNRLMQMVDDVDTGKVHLNSPTLGGEAHMPFGGTKATGVGPREMSHEGIEFFTEQATVFMDYSGGVREEDIY
jgi:acyl-CoA reductase-like NAD-dependent aldehyde dehydrogenase